MNVGMTVNKSMLMNVVYVAVISVTIATRWVVLLKRMTISIVAHLALGGFLDARVTCGSCAIAPFHSVQLTRLGP
jgi:hypothetical protein